VLDMEDGVFGVLSGICGIPGVGDLGQPGVPTATVSVLVTVLGDDAEVVMVGGDPMSSAGTLSAGVAVGSTAASCSAMTVSMTDVLSA